MAFLDALLGEKALDSVFLTVLDRGKVEKDKNPRLDSISNEQDNEGLVSEKHLFGKWLSSSVKPTTSNSRYSSLVGH